MIVLTHANTHKNAFLIQILIIDSAQTRHQTGEGNRPLANKVPSDGVVVPDKESH